MKKLLIVFLLLISFVAAAQESSRHSFGLTAGAGSARAVGMSLEGAPSLDLQNNFELGANYYRQLGERLKLESGLFYHYNKLTQKPAFNPDIPSIVTHYDVHLLYLPAFLRFNFTEHFFVNGGAIVDLDLRNSIGSSSALNSQSGLGAGLGVGGEVAILDQFYLQVNPYLNLHGVLLLQPESYPRRIMDVGIKLGIRTR